MAVKVVDPAGLRDLGPVLLDEAGRLKAVPAAELAGFTQDERTMFCVRHGVYGLLTAELLDWLRQFIAGRSAIEIGAGHGRLAELLGIPATDNRMQEWPAIAMIYRGSAQAPVRYGANVEALPAHEAVRKYSPQVVLGCWVTHKWDERRPEAGGNAWGIDEDDVLQHVEHYVVVGNEAVHQHKAIWRHPHTLHYPPWLYSRAFSGGRDFIAVWEGRARAQGRVRLRG